MNGIGTGSVVASGLSDGTYYVKDNGGARFYFTPSHVSKCTILCRSTGEAQVSKVVFLASALDNACDDCSGHLAGIQIRIKRTTFPHFAHEDYLDSFSFRSFVPEIPNGGSMTAEEVAAAVIELINTIDAYSGGPLPYTAELDPSDANNETILITSAHPDLEFEVFNIRNYPQNTITVETEAVNSTLSDEAVKQQFSLGVGFIPGRDVDESFMGCKNPCRMVIEGCIPAACGSTSPGPINSGNAVPIHAVSTPISFEIWVDKDEAGYANFITALNALITPDCTDVTPA